MVVCEIHKTRDKYKTTAQFMFDRHMFEEVSGNVRLLLPEPMRHGEMEINRDEVSFNLYVNVTQDQYLLTAYTQDKKTRFDAWQSSNNIILQFHDGGTHWHEFTRTISICTTARSPSGNITILLPEHTCDEIKAAADEYNTMLTNNMRGEDLHFGRKIDVPDLRKDMNYIPDFLFKIE